MVFTNSDGPALVRLGERMPVSVRFGAKQPDSEEESEGRLPCAPVLVEVGRLQVGARLRLGAVSQSHVDALVRSEGARPPIVVHHRDFTIADGYCHNLAARRLGRRDVECLYLCGASDAAFLESPRLNLRPGLALSPREPEGTPRQILTTHPDWSDRRLSDLCGFSLGTIERLRHADCCSGAQNRHLNVRFGKDGRRYPSDSGVLKQQVVAALDENPEASLRSVAQTPGVSPTTVRAVKIRAARSVTNEGSPRTSEPSPCPVLSSPKQRSWMPPFVQLPKPRCLRGGLSVPLFRRKWIITLRVSPSAGSTNSRPSPSSSTQVDSIRLRP